MENRLNFNLTKFLRKVECMSLGGGSTIQRKGGIQRNELWFCLHHVGTWVSDFPCLCPVSCSVKRISQRTVTRMEGNGVCKHLGSPACSKCHCMFTVPFLLLLVNMSLVRIGLGWAQVIHGSLSHYLPGIVRVVLVQVCIRSVSPISRLFIVFLLIFRESTWL